MIICQDGSLVNPYQVFSYEVMGVGSVSISAWRDEDYNQDLVSNIPAALAPAILARLAERLQERGIIRIMDIVAEVQESQKAT